MVMLPGPFYDDGFASVWPNLLFSRVLKFAKWLAITVSETGVPTKAKNTSGNPTQICVSVD